MFGKSLHQRAHEFLAKQAAPGTDLTLGELDAIVEVAGDKNGLAVELKLGYPLGDFLDAAASNYAGLLQDKLKCKAAVSIATQVRRHKVQNELVPVDGIANIIAVGSAKGGVGKSTTAANMAIALSKAGARVGLLDADIYGPSVPGLMGIQKKPVSNDNKTIEPIETHGLKLMSMGFLVDTDSAMIWRGPMVTQALQQMLRDTNWGQLDYLIVDLPPGTGDIQLTMAQKIPVSGAVIVSTPQDLALQDALRGIRMFEKVDVAVLGVVENMSTHVCSNCGHEEAIFGHGGAAQMAKKNNTALLGELPLSLPIREASDAGKPIALQGDDDTHAQAYTRLALNTAAHLSHRPRNKAVEMPKVVT